MNCMEISSPLGTLTALEEKDALVGLWMEGQKNFGRGQDLSQASWQRSPLLERLAEWLKRYFAGEMEPFPDAVYPMGSTFDQRVWTLLRQIPPGEYRTYGQLADMLQSSPRAVGGAVGRNPISIVIPCHRVLGANGRLCGYAGGLERKQLLLELEHIQYRL